ncbi:stromal cell-derived factor 2 [Chironomus tepperi]|uniref:stromal cell-derived factor 2 n=1 Tax=Chironomus tepperi TaxID=113505 RepID=UPI00391FC9C4
MKAYTGIKLLLLGLANISLIEASLKAQHVTCGSVVKLLNVDYRTRLHSHDVKYGTGSGQQSVTGVENSDDVNSHWVIKGKTGSVCDRGTVIKCGDTIRLQHLETKKNLHSHFFNSPLSGNQEVSAYGDETGEGDTGDHWEVICYGQEWLRDLKVQFRHVDTRKFLGASGRSFGRPISGQMEIVGLNSGGTGSEWQSVEGIFIHPSEIIQQNIHTEL